MATGIDFICIQKLDVQDSVYNPHGLILFRSERKILVNSIAAMAKGVYRQNSNLNFDPFNSILGHISIQYYDIVIIACLFLYSFNFFSTDVVDTFLFIH